MRLKNEDIKEIFERAQARVEVRCDEYHQHSARQGCLWPKKDGDQRDVDICKLVEELKQTRDAIRAVAADLGL